MAVPQKKNLKKVRERIKQEKRTGGPGHLCSLGAEDTGAPVHVGSRAEKNAREAQGRVVCICISVFWTGSTGFQNSQQLARPKVNRCPDGKFQGAPASINGPASWPQVGRKSFASRSQVGRKSAASRSQVVRKSATSRACQATGSLKCKGVPDIRFTPESEVSLESGLGLKGMAIRRRCFPRGS